ncbi:hypothetical protein C8R43DRAFT_1118807 [Mycena crocata]|nr:hypothetical protein C8R43DRAFT_1118807 [Mycena crocata]
MDFPVLVMSLRLALIVEPAVEGMEILRDGFEPLDRHLLQIRRGDTNGSGSFEFLKDGTGTLERKESEGQTDHVDAKIRVDPRRALSLTSTTSPSLPLKNGGKATKFKDMAPSVAATNAEVILENSAKARAADRARIAHIEAQILDLERSILSLRLEKDLAQERLASYVYPILTLPNEITSEIFLQFLPVYPICPPPTGLRSPTLLTHICRSWREIALATPSLWRAISLIFRNHPSDERKTRLLQPWMAASRSLLLAIYIDLGHRHLPLDKCIETLNLHRAQWESLHVEAITELDAIRPLLCGEPMPSLRRIALLYENVSGDPMTMADAPLLRSASIRYYPSSIILPWIQLTHLTLIDIYVSDCTAVLQQTRYLLHCDLELICSSRDAPLPNIHLPFLQSLIFRQTSNDVPEYIETFVVPALRTLQVPDQFLGTSPIPALESFIQKSGGSLKELCITRIQGKTKETLFRRAFASIPKLSLETRA